MPDSCAICPTPVVDLIVDSSPASPDEMRRPVRNELFWDVIEPTDGVLGIGSGGSYATAAGRALVRHTELGAAEACKAAMGVAGELCIYSNTQISVLEL